MSKPKMDFAPQQCRPQNNATTGSCLKIGYRPWSFISRWGWSVLRPTLCAAMATCLLVPIFTCVPSAWAQEEFGLMGTQTPACENCAKGNSAPAFEQTRVAMNNTYDASGQLGGLTESTYPSEAPMNYGSTGYDSTGFEQVSVVQTDFGQVDNGQSFDVDQGFNSGVELVSFDSQYPVQNYGQAISTGDYTQNFGAVEVQQSPLNQTYSSYREIPSVTQNQSYPPSYQRSTSSPGVVQPGLAQQKAVRAAQSGVRGHLGGGLGGAKYEGVGWSNHSAQNAISSCCYWGVRPTSQIGVSKGNDGFWYACVLYY